MGPRRLVMAADQSGRTTWKLKFQPNLVSETSDSAPQEARALTFPKKAGLCQTLWFGRAAESQEANQQDYSILRPDMARAMTSCWISLVPSKIVWLIPCRPDRSVQGCHLRFPVHLVRPVGVGPTSCRDESRDDLRNDLRTRTVRASSHRVPLRRACLRRQRSALAAAVSALVLARARRRLVRKARHESQPASPAATEQ